MKIEKADFFDMMDLACKAKGKFGVYVNDMRDFNDAEIDLHRKMGDLFLNHIKELFDLDSLLYSGEMSGLYFFETEEEMDNFYSLFETDLFDSSCVYAYTVHKNGYGLTENT